MGIATPEQYAAMLDAASAAGYAYPAVNVTSSQTLNAALRGFAEAGSDGIVQVTTGGASYLSGTGDDAGGARAFALFAHVVAEQHPTLIALHTDHCPPDRADGFLGPLLEESRSASPAAGRRCSSRTCSTGRRCRWRRTCADRRRCWIAAPPSASSSSWRSASSAAARTM